MNRIWKIVAVIAVVGAVFTGAGLLLGANTAGFSFGRGGLVMASNNLEQTRFSTGAFSNISVNVTSMDVRIEIADDFGLEVRVRDNSNFTHSIVDGTLTISQGRFTNINFGIFGGWSREYVTIFIPRDAMFESVDLRVTSGRINVNDLDAVSFAASLMSGNASLNGVTAQTVYARTTSGRISITNVDAVNTLELRAMSGNINITNATAGYFELRTTSGRIRGTGITANGLDANVLSGNIRLSGTFNGRSNVNATSGSVRLDVRGSESDFLVSASVTSGRARINGNRVTHNINANADNTITARTTSGNVNINFTR